MGTAVALPMLTFAPVVAYAATTTETPATPTTTTTTTTTAPSTAAKEKTETAAQRLAKNKATYVATLTAAQQASLKIKCKPAQAKGKLLSVGITKSNTERVAAYTKISTGLDKIITKLKDADFDTKDLQTQKTELQKLITTYNTDVASYQTALSDLNDIDCTTDPAGFKSSLEAARAARAVVAKDALAIRTYITGTIQLTLKEARTTLAKDDTTKTTEGAQ